MTRRAWPRPWGLAPRPSRPPCYGQPQGLPRALPLSASITIVVDSHHRRINLPAKGRLQLNLALSPDRRDAAASDTALLRVRAPAEATLRLFRTLDAASDAAPCVAPSSNASAPSTIRYRSFCAPGRSTRSAVVSAMSRVMSVDAEFGIRWERTGPGVG